MWLFFLSFAILVVVISNYGGIFFLLSLLLRDLAICCVLLLCVRHIVVKHDSRYAIAILSNDSTNKEDRKKTDVAIFWIPRILTFFYMIFYFNWLFLLWRVKIQHSSLIVSSTSQVSDTIVALKRRAIKCGFIVSWLLLLFFKDHQNSRSHLIHSYENPDWMQNSVVFCVCAKNVDPLSTHKQKMKLEIFFLC